MKPVRTTTGGMTLIELLCVIAIVAILAALLLPALSQGQARSKRVRCIANLSQMGVAFLSFAQDHQGKFPMQTPIEAGGTMELVNNSTKVSGPFYFGFKHFQAISNELVSTRLLVCPADTRIAAFNFPTLANHNISYFLSANAAPHDSVSYLAGDRNITNAWLGPATIMRPGPGLSWSGEMHRFKGNLLYADGHVEQRTSLGASPGLQAGGTLPELWVPTANPQASPNSPGTPAVDNPSGNNPAGNPPAPTTPATLTRKTPPNPLLNLPPPEIAQKEPYAPAVPGRVQEPIRPGASTARPGANPTLDSAKPAPALSNPPAPAALAAPPVEPDPSPVLTNEASLPASKKTKTYSLVSSLFLLLLLLLLLAAILIYAARRLLTRLLAKPKGRPTNRPFALKAQPTDPDLD